MRAGQVGDLSVTFGLTRLGTLRVTRPTPKVFPVGEAKQAPVPITMTNWGRERIRASRLA